MKVVPPPHPAPLCGIGIAAVIVIPGSSAKVVDDGSGQGTGSICATGSVFGYNHHTQKLGIPKAVWLNPNATIPPVPVGLDGDVSHGRHWFFVTNEIPNILHAASPGQGNQLVVWVPILDRASGAVVCQARAAITFMGVTARKNDCHKHKKKKH